MGHLLPVLARFNYSAVNFGPTVLASDIRKHMPRTVIDGQLAPFTLSRNEEENIVLEFLRDHDMTRETRGLKFSTAGSINNGSRLTSMRLMMSAIQHFGQFGEQAR
jgi:uroporphyrinogen decarboxylase